MPGYQYPLPPLYFLHIPKTAGTSLKYWLYDFYGPHEVLRIENAEQLSQVTREEINHARLISGHFGWQLFDFLDTPRPAITWLREPVKRALSNFRYIREKLPLLIEEAQSLGRLDWVADYQRRMNLDFQQIIDEKIGFEDNLQIRHLTGCFGKSEPIFIDETLLEQAQRNLDSLSFAGICEWMDQSVDLCSFRLGFPYHSLRLTFNVTTTKGNRDEFSPSDLEKLEHVERYDRRLYDYAVQKFEQSFAAFWQQVHERQPLPFIQPGGFENASELLREVRSKYSQLSLQQVIKTCINENFSKVHADLPLVDEGEMRFEDAVFLNNWYPRWPGEKPGSILRWAGPENSSTVLLPLKPQFDYEVAFLVENCSDPKFIENMSVFANGFPVVTKIKFVKRKALAWFLIPRATISHKHQMTEVAIYTPGEIPVSDIPHNPRICFSASRFWFRATARDRSLAQSWLTDFEETGQLPNTIPKPTAAGVPAVVAAFAWGEPLPSSTHDW